MEKYYNLKNTSLKRFPGLTTLIEKILFLPHFSRLQQNVSPLSSPYEIIDSYRKQLNMSLKYEEEDLKNIPAKGAVIVVANHPFGVADAGLIMLTIAKVRQDVKALANYIFAKNTPFSSLVFNVDPFTKKTANAKNREAIKMAKRWLEEEKLLVVFPSGTVSHWQFKKCKSSILLGILLFQN